MRVLFVTARPPWPTRRGDQSRAVSLLVHLARRHEVRVVALAPPSSASDPPPSGIALRCVPGGRLAMLGGLLRYPGRPGQVAIHQVGALRRTVAREIEAAPPDVVVVMLSRVAGAVPSSWRGPVVVDFIDALSLNMRNRAARQPLLAPLWRFEARRIADWDRRLVRRVSCATVVAERDRREIAGSDELLTARVRVIPLGVRVGDAAPYRPAPDPVIVLSGNLGYFPTVDGAAWFARHVWPRVRESRPDAIWRLAGARPAPSIRALAALPGVEVVPDPVDLAALTAGAAVGIAPLRAGSGTPNKVLEAMAGGTPVVATPEAAAGLDDVPADGLRVVGDAAGWAEAVCELLAHEDRRERQVRAAWEWVRAQHSLRTTGEAFEKVLAEAAAR